MVGNQYNIYFKLKLIKRENYSTRYRDIVISSYRMSFACLMCNASSLFNRNKHVDKSYSGTSNLKTKCTVWPPSKSDAEIPVHKIGITVSPFTYIVCIIFLSTLYTYVNLQIIYPDNTMYFNIAKELL